MEEELGSVPDRMACGITLVPAVTDVAAGAGWLVGTLLRSASWARRLSNDARCLGFGTADTARNKSGVTNSLMVIFICNEVVMWSFHR